MAMRTVPFKSVFDAIARRHGMDPRGDAILSDAAQTICERINSRVDTAWRLWEWPQVTLTEERAYRQIWNTTRQFHIVGENGKPDEVFYMPQLYVPPPTGPIQSLEGAAYYRVKDTGAGDPPVGTPPVLPPVPPATEGPVNGTYWELIDPLDRFVAYDQICKRPIGEMLGVYCGNPRLTTPHPLSYCVSEKGIDVFAYSGLTVFVKYQLVPSRFSMMPYIDGKTYNRGDLVYRSTTGECYQALGTNVNKVPENEPGWWLKVPFPDFLSEYTKAGVYSDGLRDTDHALEQGGSGLGMHYAILARQQKIQALDAEADEYLTGEIDSVRAQGQHFRYPPFALPLPTYPPLPPGYWMSPPWTTGTNGSSNVTTLTDQCEWDVGYMPSPPPPPALGWEYHPEIISLTGPEPSLQGLDAAGRAVASLVKIVLTPGGSPQEQEYQLRGGAADPADPGHVAPHDYNLATNNKHWARVG